VFRFVATSALVLVFSSVCMASSVTEVLYLAEPQGSQYSLLTYNVNPESAAATQVGRPVTINASSMDPLTVNGKHFLYVWNATDVWVYPTTSKGVPKSQPSEHLMFAFSYPVYSFVADPDGKFAYSAYNWTDDQNNVYTNIILFTIDQSTGVLTNTGKVVGTYGPNASIVMDNLLFGLHGRRLYAHWNDDGPYTDGIGYYFYAVNQETGALGKVQNLFYAQTLECGSSCGAAISDATSTNAGVCCGPGSGSIVFARNSNGQNFACETQFAFCSDDVAGLYLDPLGRNLFFGDATVNQVYVAHIDFATSQLIPTSLIPGTPPLDFSPDSKLVYAINSNTIGIYALESSTGYITASSTLSDSGKVSVATATF
jgi:DNA-binding beta-propeller fold protein YncE